MNCGYESGEGRGGVIRDPEGLATTSPSLLPSLCPYPRGISNWFTRKQDCLIFLLVPWRHGWDSCLDAWLSRHVQSLVTWLNQRVTLFYYNYNISKIFYYLFFILFERGKTRGIVFVPHRTEISSISRWNSYRSFVQIFHFGSTTPPISMLSTLRNVLMIKQVALVSRPAVKHER